MQPSPPPPGWHPDPTQPAQWRWWDGTQWSAHTSPMVGGPPSLEPSATMRALLPVGRTWQAIVAGYVGLFAIVVIFLGPVALGLGIWGLRIDPHGKGRSVFAVVAGVWGTFWTLFVIARTA